jgi:hypothetical protein
MEEYEVDYKKYQMLLCEGAATMYIWIMPGKALNDISKELI